MAITNEIDFVKNIELSNTIADDINCIEIYKVTSVLNNKIVNINFNKDRFDLLKRQYIKLFSNFYENDIKVIKHQNHYLYYAVNIDSIINDYDKFICVKKIVKSFNLVDDLFINNLQVINVSPLIISNDFTDVSVKYIKRLSVIISDNILCNFEEITEDGE